MNFCNCHCVIVINSVTSNYIDNVSHELKLDTYIPMYIYMWPDLHKPKNNSEFEGI